MQRTNRKAVTLRWFLMVVVAAVSLSLSMSSVMAKEAKRSLDINTASQQELEELKGIGPSTAKKIIEHRPYTSLDELSKAGISAKNIAALKPFVTVGPTAAKPQPAKAATKSDQAPAVAEKPAAKATAAKAGAEPTDLNTADQKTLESLPGVGPKTAQEIIKARPFKSVEDLSKVKGINKGTIEKLKGLVTVTSSKALQSSAPAATPVAPIPATPTKVSPAPMTAPAASAPVTPAKAAPGAEKAATATKLAPGEKVNINTASKEKLEALPGIGPVKAQAIIDSRPFSNSEDIMKVKGIKGGEFSKIKDMITIK